MMENLVGNSNHHLDSHKDLKGDDEFIIISCKKVPGNWTEATDILSYKSLDRNFVFPGERVQVLACLRGPKQDIKIITPFKVASMMNEKRIGSHPERSEDFSAETSSVMQANTHKSSDQGNLDCDAIMEGHSKTDQDVAAAQSFIRLEDQRNRTEKLLQAIKRSHFFARIVETDEDILPTRRSRFSHSVKRKLTGEKAKTKRKNNTVSSMVDGGDFNGRTTGGLARGAVECCSLSNGDIVVLLQVNVGVKFLSDAILEIVQFENNHVENTDLMDQHATNPSRELLKWLLPLDNPLPASAHPKSPPILSSFSSIRGTSTKTSVPGSSGSQLLSHFRSYSMSSLPQTTALPQVITAPTAKQSSFDPGDWNQFSFKRRAKMGKTGIESLLSFRGMPLDPRRFSVRCGLQGVFTFARSWRRRIQLIHPIEIRSFSSDCNTDDLICVQVKNVCPEIAPDIVMFIDSICLIVEDPSNGGPAMSLPVASVEVGNDCNLPNLMLRRGEQHSFLLKPATAFCKHAYGRTARTLKSEYTCNASSSCLSSNIVETQDGSMTYQCSVVVSCHCNYTDSKLFFKHPTSWKPRIPKDLLITVTSEMSKLTLGPDGTELPVQVLSLAVSNRTSEDLTMTLVERVQNEQKVHDSPVVNGEISSEFDVSDGNPACTHLWLRSNVPLGCVPSHSMATIKLEILPLSKGIITLDSLQIDVKEKDFSYMPEHAPKIDGNFRLHPNSIT